MGTPDSWVTTPPSTVARYPPLGRRSRRVVGRHVCNRLFVVPVELVTKTTRSARLPDTMVPRPVRPGASA